MLFRVADLDDADNIKELYTEVARQGGGIARTEDEITEDYVTDFITKSMESGLIIVAEHPKDKGLLVAEIHAYKPGIKMFNHLLTNLTIVVHPDFQGKKIGRSIFTIFQEEIVRTRPDIGKVELMTRESNRKAIEFYQKIGFMIEGRMEMRVRTLERTYEADIVMGWQNPNFEF